MHNSRCKKLQKFLHAILFMFKLRDHSFELFYSLVTYRWLKQIFYRFLQGVDVGERNKNRQNFFVLWNIFIKMFRLDTFIVKSFVLLICSVIWFFFPLKTFKIVSSCLIYKWILNVNGKNWTSWSTLHFDCSYYIRNTSSTYQE